MLGPTRARSAMTAVAPIRPSPTRISCSAICRPICSTARSPSTPKPPARDRRASADRAGYRQGRRPDLRSRQAHRRPGDLDATRRYHPAAAGPYRRGPPFRQLGRPRSIAPWSPRARRTEKSPRQGQAAEAEGDRRRHRKDRQETAHDLLQGELWSLTPSGRRIVVDVLMRRRGQTGRPRSVHLCNVCLKKARRRAFR